MSKAYKNAVRVLEKWPLDASKKGRDLGEGFRLLISQSLPAGNSTILTDEKYINRQIHASRLLSEDHFVKKHPRIYESNFTGVPLVDLKKITATDVMGELSDGGPRPGLFKRFKNSFT